MTFPRDDYTPYGYLANPAARATSWSDHHGGSLRTAGDVVGLGWSYPWEKRPAARMELVLRLRVGERVYTTRDEWAQLGLHSAYHSANLLSFNWSAADVAGEWRLLLSDPHTLIGIVELRNDAPFARSHGVEVLMRAWCDKGDPVVEAAGDGWRVPPVAGAPEHRLLVLEPGGLEPARVDALAVGESAVAAGFDWALELAPGQVVRLAVALRREEAQQPVDPWAAERAARAEDEAFWANAPRLAGDWPAHWRRGWVYDLETTRLCLHPPSGIFADVWLTWMVHWPRVVVAEGTLDGLRLGYAAPDLAKRAVLTLFRDAPAANVPCVFEGGEPNMVAQDGSVCGTSPAWCLPFYNVEALYRWTLDQEWLAALYPHLAAYLRWWLAERRDEAGAIVYRCTWEAGEDNTPRLDPAGEGDHVITEFTRPVELQAMMAQSAAVLDRLAAELGHMGEQESWAAVAAEYRARTRALWDEAEGRFRDWDKRRGAFVEPVGRAEYWAADPRRYSPLSLTPLLDGIATPEQARRLAAELPAYDTSPWCDWPSWTYAVVESAGAAGAHAFAARMAARIVDRIYRRNDRRDLHGYARPLPGVAPEYWPTDVATYTGSDGYGWGATTLSLLLRQIIGLTESEDTADWSLCLTPGLPDALMRPGHEYCLQGITYRGRRIDLSYIVEQDGTLTARLRFAEPVALTVTVVPPLADDDVPAQQEREVACEHHLSVKWGQRCRVAVPR